MREIKSLRSCCYHLWCLRFGKWYSNCRVWKPCRFRNTFTMMCGSFNNRKLLGSSKLWWLLSSVESLSIRFQCRRNLGMSRMPHPIGGEAVCWPAVVLSRFQTKRTKEENRKYVISLKLQMKKKLFGYFTSPGSNTPQDTNCTATCPLSRKLFKLGEPDMQDIAGEAEMNS